MPTLEAESSPWIKNCGKITILKISLYFLDCLHPTYSLVDIFLWRILAFFFLSGYKCMDPFFFKHDALLVWFGCSGDSLGHRASRTRTYTRWEDWSDMLPMKWEIRGSRTSLMASWLVLSIVVSLSRLFGRLISTVVLGSVQDLLLFSSLVEFVPFPATILYSPRALAVFGFRLSALLTCLISGIIRRSSSLLGTPFFPYSFSWLWCIAFIQLLVVSGYLCTLIEGGSWHVFFLCLLRWVWIVMSWFGFLFSQSGHRKVYRLHTGFYSSIELVFFYFFARELIA